MCQSCADNYQRIARKLLRELEAGWLEVVLMPGREWTEKHPDRDKIRVVERQNAPWYQDFCASYESRRKDLHKWRKFKTKIKRQWVVKALCAMAEGKVNTIYADRLLDFMRDRKHQQRRMAA